MGLCGGGCWEGPGTRRSRGCDISVVGWRAGGGQEMGQQREAGGGPLRGQAKWFGCYSEAGHRRMAGQYPEQRTALQT